MINEVKIQGTLVNEVQLRYTKNGLAVAQGRLKSVKAPKNGKDRKGFNFIPFVAWGDQATEIANKTKKDSEIYLVGEWQSGSYEKDGKKFYTTDLNVEQVRIKEAAPVSEETLPF